MGKKLQPKEHLEIELALREVQVLEGKAEVLEKRKRICQLEKAMLQYQCTDKDRSVQQLSKEVSTVKSKIDRQKEERNEVLDRIKKRLKIKGAFGYDPDTLEVIEDE